MRQHYSYILCSIQYTGTLKVAPLKTFKIIDNNTFYTAYIVYCLLHPLWTNLSVGYTFLIAT